MSNQPLPFIIQITRHLPKAEAGFIAGAVIGVMLKYAGMDSLVFNVSLVGLAATFFLSAYRVIEIPEARNEKQGFMELLIRTIVPKVAWISCAVVTIGILFYFIGAEGYKQMLFIGGSTMLPVMLIILFGIVSGVRHISAITPVLYRLIPLTMLAGYMYFR